MLGIDENTITAVEQWYEGDFLPALDTHFGAHDYLLGGVASIGDLALMGHSMPICTRIRNRAR